MKLVVYELIRNIIQKILQDKILLGLVVICVIGLFVGGMTMGDDKDAKKDKGQAQEQEQASGSSEKGEQQQPASDKLTPTLATDFIGWWLTGGMDYNAATAMQSHQQAMSWMTPQAATSFANTFWTPQIAESVSTGRLVAAFQPTSVQAAAINPDGSIVVSVAGTVVVQTGSQPAVQRFGGNFLVRQEKEGLRIAGLEATGGAPGSSVF